MAAVSAFRADLMAGKVVVVTGGATGIGLGMCRAFGKHGAKVVMCGRRENVLQAACAELAKDGVEAAGFTCDVRDPEKCVRVIEQAVERFGRVDVLVNNAAGNFSVPAEYLTPNGFKTVMGIDLHGSFHMSKAAFPELKKCRGVIINISATLHYTAFPFQMHASAAKAAIDVMTNNLGVEWGTDGVRCVGIAPGPIAGTVGGVATGNDSKNGEGKKGRVFGSFMEAAGANDPKYGVPLARWGTVDDIANAALFVASSAGAFINATTLVVDGGSWHQATRPFLMAKEMVAAASKEERKSFKGGVEKKSKL